MLSTGIDYLIGLLIDRAKITRHQYWKATSWIFGSAIFYLLITWPSDGFNISQVSINPLGLKIIPGLALAWGLASLFLRDISRKEMAIDKRKIYVGISISSNLIILCFFKYFNFFIDSAEEVIHSLGGDAQLYQLDIILPVGISFYTFQTISYSIDIYRKQVKPTGNFLDFALFVAYFPQLVAGPIERAKNLLPRILYPRSVSYEQATRGVFLISWGLFKKIAIADSVAASVNSVYNTTGAVSWLDVILATVLFAIQIYCDFSAYSDIARGTSKLLGIELMRNFNLPYFASNPSEFWRRWHISLSSWLRDYLYIPLGGNKHGSLKTYRNLSITMLLGGLWHGAAWNFILWGGYQGAILSIHRFFTINKKRATPSGFISGLKIILFFAVTCYGWLLFRANSVSQIIDFTSILLFQWPDMSIHIKRPPLVAMLSIPLLFLYEIIEYKSGNILFYLRTRRPILGGVVAYTLLLIAMGLSNEPTQFIYFQF
ncbi:MAG: MBOAT family O-acyltransferase [Candidatus Sedimenticola sp. (ex Thyasira tokunagai)]